MFGMEGKRQVSTRWDEITGHRVCGLSEVHGTAAAGRSCWVPRQGGFRLLGSFTCPFIRWLPTRLGAVSQVCYVLVSVDTHRHEGIIYCFGFQEFFIIYIWCGTYTSHFLACWMCCLFWAFIGVIYRFPCCALMLFCNMSNVHPSIFLEVWFALVSILSQ